MKILHVVDSLNAGTGGVAMAVSRLADAQAALGIDVTVLAHDYAELGDVWRPTTARSVLAPARRMPFRLGARSRTFRPLLARETAASSVVHIHGCWLPTNLYAARAAHRSRVPTVISPRGMLEPWSLGHRALRKRLIWQLWERNNLNAAAGLHATAAAETGTFRTLGLTRPIAQIPDAVDIPEEPGDRAILERRFPSLVGQKWLLFLSRLHKKKGIEMLLGAWSRLQNEAQGWHLIIAGTAMDGEQGHYETLAGTLGAGGRTTFVGHLEGEEKASAYAGCEIFVLPTYSENFGIVVAEALAASRPVITTTGTPWEIIAKTGCGWWITPDEAALEECLRDALNRDPDHLRAMGAIGTTLMAEHFSWPAGARQLASFYSWILGQGAAPDFVHLA